MEPQRYKKTKILFLLLLISLLLHLIMSFFFLEFGFRKRFTSFVTALSNSITSLSSKDKQIIEQKREHKHEALQKIFEAARKNKKPINFVKPSDSRPAKMVAPKSNFGWVMFDDNYEKPKKLGIPTTKTGDVMEVKLSNATETKPKKLEPKVEQPQGEHDIKPDGTVKKQKSAEIKQKINPKQLTAKNKINLEPTKEVKRSADTVIVDENIRKDLTTADKQILVTKKQIEPEEQVNTQEQVIQIDDRIKKIREMQEAVAEFQKGPKTKEQEREGLLGSILKKDKKTASSINEQEKATDFAWGASSLKPKQSKNIIALTKGYIEKTSGENGTDLIDRDGDPNKIPSFEEMKYVSYEAKLNWCCQATWKQNSSFYNLPIAQRDYQAVIEFSIDEKGNLVNSEILESSGCKEVDSAIVKNLKATAPFPPLPKHFGKDIYTTGRVITVSINRMLF
ncbi:MAG: energy transducer TonB [Candidatus Babeliales bacterium]|jgi:TonB family protein